MMVTFLFEGDSSGDAQTRQAVDESSGYLCFVLAHPTATGDPK